MQGASDPHTLLHNATLLQHAGRLAEAEAAYRQLLTQWPDQPDTWYNLALLQRHMGQYDAALASYQQALDRGVDQPEEVHLNRGVIYSDCLRQDAAAENELNAALTCNPNYLPALLNLANLKEDYGKRVEAISLYERLLALAPNHHEALSRYASLKLARDPHDPLIATLRKALASDATQVADKASLGFALGKVLDACGDYDNAFAAYTMANRHSRALSPPEAVLYDAHAHERFIDDLIAAFPNAAAAAATVTTPRPIFICGMFRSGSTLTEQILAAHTHVTAGGELPFLPSLASRELAPFPASLRGMEESRLQQLAQRYRDELQRLFPAATTVTDKRPDNFLYIGLIKRLFPDAKIVHTTRQALDNCLSIYFLHLDHHMGYALDLADIGHYYAQYRRLMTHWRSLYGDDILDFDYDTFVREPRHSTENLLRFCDLEWQDNCLNFERVDNAVRTASVWQVRQPVYRQSSGRWQHYARNVEALRDWLNERGLL